MDTREYFDVGASVSAIPQIGGDPLVLNRMENMPDPSSGGLVHPIVYLGGDPAILVRNGYYDIEIEGTADYPAFDLRNGITNTGIEWPEPELFMPPNFAMIQPPNDEYFVNTDFTQGEDFTLEWENEETIQEGSPSNITFVGFYNTEGAIDFYCLAEDGPDGGSMVIPKEVIAEIEPKGGSMLLGKFTHMAWNQGNRANARFDFLGTNCSWGPYTVVEP